MSDLQSNFIGGYYGYPHFTDKKTEVEKKPGALKKGMHHQAEQAWWVEENRKSTWLKYGGEE